MSAFDDEMICGSRSNKYAIVPKQTRTCCTGQARERFRSDRMLYDRPCDAVCLENAIDSNRQRRTDLAHSIVSEPAEPLGERPHPNALNRIKVDG